MTFPLRRSCPNKLDGSVTQENQRQIGAVGWAPVPPLPLYRKAKDSRHVRDGLGTEIAGHLGRATDEQSQSWVPGVASSNIFDVAVV